MYWLQNAFYLQSCKKTDNDFENNGIILQAYEIIASRIITGKIRDPINHGAGKAEE